MYWVKCIYAFTLFFSNLFGPKEFLRILFIFSMLPIKKRGHNFYIFIGNDDVLYLSEYDGLYYK